MQTETVERLGLDELSQESRRQLHDQIGRVRKEAKKLRMQARRLRRAQHAETRQRRKLLEQVALSSKELGQSMLQRGGDLATSGVALASAQLAAGQQKVRAYGENLVQGMSQLGSQATHNLGSTREDVGNRLSRQRQQWGQAASDWSDEAAYRLRRQGRQLVQNTTDWGDEAAYRLHRQRQTFLHRLADWGDEAMYRLRRYGRNATHQLFERKEETAHQIALQKRDLSRNLADRREDATHQLLRQGRKLGRNLSNRREDATRQLRKQRDYLSERGGQLLEPVKGRRIWSVLGFASGLLLAGGVTYWLVRRNLSRTLVEEEESIELMVSEPLDGTPRPSSGEKRSHRRQGGTALATRPTLATTAGPTTRFVGVLSSRLYYPLELKPDARDLVFFDTAEDAQAEGFSKGK